MSIKLEEQTSMKILVAVKHVIDPNVKVRVCSDGTGVETSNVKMAMYPFDEIALEEAVRLKEAGTASEVIAVSIGEPKAQDTLRTALAKGADRAIHIQSDAIIEQLGVAKILKAVVERENPEIVLLGKQAIDDDANQTAQMLAQMLGWGQGTFASKVELSNGSALVTREIDGGLETLNLRLPCVISADLRLNEPRFASLPNIMKAKKKPLDALDLEELGVDTSPRLEILSVEEPAQRQAGQIVASVSELVEKLKTEAKVI